MTTMLTMLTTTTTMMSMPMPNGRVSSPALGFHRHEHSSGVSFVLCRREKEKIKNTYTGQFQLKRFLFV